MSDVVAMVGDERHAQKQQRILNETMQPTDLSQSHSMFVSRSKSFKDNISNAVTARRESISLLDDLSSKIGTMLELNDEGSWFPTVLALQKIADKLKGTLDKVDHDYLVTEFDTLVDTRRALHQEAASAGLLHITQSSVQELMELGVQYRTYAAALVEMCPKVLSCSDTSSRLLKEHISKMTNLKKGIEFEDSKNSALVVLTIRALSEDMAVLRQPSSPHHLDNHGQGQ
ncbi:hypothetical protein M231_00558 [Tremella mesenterica]|uniref:Uncharacterized protein n=1 Tax=Tremella mesenterica TaxID=5217 RepID=A0A4Q1BVP8_TREME|nr:hypothetical protein M231_00558 [Tremella mesenterica]